MKCMDEKRNQKLSVHFPFTTRKATQREMEDLRASVCEIGERLQQTQGKLAGANAEINRLTNAPKSERSAHKNTYFKLGASVEQAEYLLDQLICLRDNVSDLAAGKYEKVYQDICGTLDPEGWKLYWAAEKYTGIDPFHAFPTEDNLGYFENMDGHGLIMWIEISAFGECEWEQLDCAGGYERAVNPIVHTDTEKYAQYRSAIYEQAVREMLGLKSKEEIAHDAPDKKSRMSGQER